MTRIIKLAIFITMCLPAFPQQNLKINDFGYFEMQGLNVMVFNDIYPDGHQTGITIIQHGSRVAANGDLRLEASPGQWSPIPKAGQRVVDRDKEAITQRLWYPDSTRNRKGFNPILYPDLTVSYCVAVTALEGRNFLVSVHLDEPIPSEWIGKVSFTFELFPGELFGKSWIMDQHSGIFLQQPGGPVILESSEYLSAPLAVGKRFVVAPEANLQRIRFESVTGNLELRDGRSNHNNGWFIVRETVPPGATRNAIQWKISPNVVEGWLYKPVVQVSQLGYHPDQPKVAIIETDPRDTLISEVMLFQMTDKGRRLVRKGEPEFWGKFLRYNYLRYDFSDIHEPGMYLLAYGDTETHAFQIDRDVYSRHAWQPVIEYFLPVQMCHMRVNEKYRVWHDRCHLDDALMAPVDTIHFDGYSQGSSTLTKYQPMTPVPGLNRGGWHDAGDYDLRVESQTGTIWNLALMIEEFGLDYDATLIDQENRLVEIHVPDGKPDAIQQIEHGLLAVLGGYSALGRLYRGIICPTLHQYVMLGDASAMTDNLVYDTGLKPGEITAGTSSLADDRWVFTEQNPGRELYVAAGLAAASRVLKESNPELSAETLNTAKALYEGAASAVNGSSQQVVALCELLISTGDDRYRNTLISLKDDIIRQIHRCGWALGRVLDQIDDPEFQKDVTGAVMDY